MEYDILDAIVIDNIFEMPYVRSIEAIRGEELIAKFTIPDQHQLKEYSFSDTEIGICIHGYKDSLCYACGKRQCTHRNAKSRNTNYCKFCGKGYCEHKILKYRCKDCGTGYCEHKRRKNSCKDCKGIKKRKREEEENFYNKKQRNK